MWTVSSVFEKASPFERLFRKVGSAGFTSFRRRAVAARCRTPISGMCRRDLEMYTPRMRIRNSEFGIRNSEFGIRKRIFLPVNAERKNAHKLKNLLTKQNWRAETNNLEISKIFTNFKIGVSTSKSCLCKQRVLGAGTARGKFFEGVWGH